MLFVSELNSFAPKMHTCSLPQQELPNYKIAKIAYKILYTKTMGVYTSD